MKLEGLLVLDLSRFPPGPYVGGQTVYFRNTQRGKKSCELDRKSEAGLAAFHHLARRADVIVEAFRPGVAGKLGIDYETIRAINSRIVYCALSAFASELAIVVPERGGEIEFRSKGRSRHFRSPSAECDRQAA